MIEFDPRDKNRKYVARNLSGVMGFVSVDGEHVFSHQRNFEYVTPGEGRISEIVDFRRSNMACDDTWRTTDDVRRSDGDEIEARIGRELR